LKKNDFTLTKPIKRTKGQIVYSFYDYNIVENLYCKEIKTLSFYERLLAKNSTKQYLYESVSIL